MLAHLTAIQQSSIQVPETLSGSRLSDGCGSAS
jgi:hypothetical protein